MENNNDKYKGFANAADYFKDIQARYAVFASENAEYMAHLDEQEKNGILETYRYDPQHMQDLHKMIDIIEDPEHAGVLEHEELAAMFEEMKETAEFDRQNEAFLKELHDALMVIQEDKIESAKGIIQTLTQAKELIEEQLAEKGHDPELVERLEKIEGNIRYYQRDVAISTMKRDAMQSHVQN